MLLLPLDGDLAGDEIMTVELFLTTSSDGMGDELDKELVVNRSSLDVDPSSLELQTLTLPALAERTNVPL